MDRLIQARSERVGKVAIMRFLEDSFVVCVVLEPEGNFRRGQFTLCSLEELDVEPHELMWMDWDS